MLHETMALTGIENAFELERRELALRDGVGREGESVVGERGQGHGGEEAGLDDGRGVRLADRDGGFVGDLHGERRGWEPVGVCCGSRER